MGELPGVSVAVTNRRPLGRAQRAVIVSRTRHPGLAGFGIIAVFQIKVAVPLGADQKYRQLVVETALNVPPRLTGLLFLAADLGVSSASCWFLPNPHV